MLNLIFLLNSGWVLLFVRIVLGVIMIYYGWPKIKDLKANAEDFSGNIGFKPGWLWGTATALIEFVGGIAILAGFFTEIVAALFAIQMATGLIWKIMKADKPFTDWSYDLLLLTVSLTILTFGPGFYSVLSLF